MEDTFTQVHWLVYFFFNILSRFEHPETLLVNDVIIDIVKIQIMGVVLNNVPLKNYYALCKVYPNTHLTQLTLALGTVQKCIKEYICTCIQCIFGCM